MNRHSIVVFSLLAIGATSLGWQLGVEKTSAPMRLIETVFIRPGVLEYRPPGEFLQDGLAVTVPLRKVRIVERLEVMKYQVSAVDYLQCVNDRACQPLGKRARPREGMPATGVSYMDAVTYARWLSEKTGDHWRLPTDAEWSYAAAEKYGGDLFTVGQDPDNPSVAWIKQYREQAEARRQPEPQPRPAGSFGLNSFGLADFSGNVWEWTSDCYVRITLASNPGGEPRRVENCGVRVLGGRHRTYMSDFIRDGKSGGCAVGTPPDNLGFRLIREPHKGMASLWRSFRKSLGV